MFSLSLFTFFLASLSQSVLSSSSQEPMTLEPHPVDVQNVSAAPHFVLYTDAWVSGETGPPNASAIAGFNVLALSFLLETGPADQALEWSLIADTDRASYLAEYEAAGISLIVSAYGSTDTPTTSGTDPVQQANFMGAWVTQYGLAGLDVDYEDFAAMDKGDGSAEAWLASFTQQIRTILPQGQFILTHAPVAPWFSVNSAFSGGAYLKVDQTVGSLIDWYNVQFYNQGVTEYTTCDSLLNTDAGSWPGSALFEIVASGVPADKLVIGKPASAGDASNGYIDPTTLAGCLDTATQNDWNAGVMTWEYPDAAASWIATVRAQAFPQ